MEPKQRRKLKDFNLHNCPVVYSLNKIGNRWKLLILHYIRQGHNRYSTLQKAIPEISRQTLTNQLRELEADGILARNVYPQVPPRVEYEMTEIGRSLQPIIAEMSKWGLRFVTPTEPKMINGE
jgi:DNA-binding HxlR family transcriptional regulator